MVKRLILLYSKKILVLGITGRTDSLVASEAIKRGHKFVGIARDKSRVKVTGAEIIEVTPYDYETVNKAITLTMACSRRYWKVHLSTGQS